MRPENIDIAPPPDAPSPTAGGAERQLAQPSNRVAIQTQPTLEAMSVLEANSRNHYLHDRLGALRSAAQAPALAAALVIDGDTVAAAVDGARVYGGEQAKLGDAFMLKSCTKPMTGYLAARFVAMAPAVGAGHFHWETRIIDVFPELVGTMNPAYFQTTVWQLMTHTSGMPYKPIGEGSDEFKNATSSLTGRRYAYVKAAVLDPPVSPSPYGGGSIIVAAMLERITGRAWEDLMQQYVFGDLGMTNAGVGETPYPQIPNMVSSHDRDSSGTPVPWLPPTDYASEPHAPAGRNPHASILDFARFAAAFLPNATHRPGSLSVAQVQNALSMPPMGNAAMSGWGTGNAPWDGSPIYWHNGTDGRDYSLVHLSPSENFATLVMTNVEDGQLASAATLELAAMQRHFATASAYESAVNLAVPAQGSAVFGAGYEADKAVDGSLATRWATPDGTQTASLTLDLGTAKAVSHVRVAEEYARVEGFVIEAWQATFPGHAAWVPVLSGTTLGADFSGDFSATTARWFRLRVTAASGAPTIAEVWLF
jgi:CubicO group peptidase (beta-lactamase class C family)